MFITSFFLCIIWTTTYAYRSYSLSHQSLTHSFSQPHPLSRPYSFPFSITQSHTYSLAQSQPFPHSLAHSQPHSQPHTYSLAQTLSLAQSHTYSLAHSLPHSLKQSHTYSLSQSLNTYSLAQSQPHSLKQSQTLYSSTHSPSIQSPAPSPSRTLTPSQTFTQLPSQVPSQSYSQTNEPTHTSTIETNQPTHTPTIETNQPTPTITPPFLPIASFTTEFVIIVSSNAPYDSQTKKAICSATTTTLEIDSNDCNYLGTSFADHISKLLQTSYSASSTLSISVVTANPAAFFTTASNNLAIASSNGLLASNLVSACNTLGVTGPVASAVVVGATASNLIVIVIMPPTLNPSPRPSTIAAVNTSSNKDLSPGNIAVIVVMSCIVGLIAGIIYYTKITITTTNIVYKNIPTIEPQVNLAIESDSFLSIDDETQKLDTEEIILEDA